MAWFKVDDAFYSHPKVVRLPPKAGWLWTRAGSWAADQLTDGHVPRYVLPMLGGTAADARALEEAGLWKADRDGWTFHDWADYQPSRAEVEAKRAAGAERVTKFRERKRREAHATGNAPGNALQDDV